MVGEHEIHEELEAAAVRAILEQPRRKMPTRQQVRRQQVETARRHLTMINDLNTWIAETDNSAARDAFISLRSTVEAVFENLMLRDDPTLLDEARAALESEGQAPS
jgi:hypothetical protein